MQVSKYLTSRKAGEFTLSNPLEEEILENSISALQAVNIQIAVKGIEGTRRSNSSVRQKQILHCKTVKGTVQRDLRGVKSGINR